jgi:uncharacterized integral membrane protein
MRTAVKAKVITAIVLGVIAAIIALQNLEPVDTTLLFATVTMPRILILLIMLGIGFVLGVVLSYIWTTRLLAVGGRGADRTTEGPAPQRRTP